MTTVQDLAGRVGESLGETDWLTIDQAMIDTFAEATGDRQFIHVDVEKAKLTPFGGTIAHGFLALSLFPRLFASLPDAVPDGLLMAVNYGGDKTRFLAPVKSGARVRGRFKLLAMDEKRPGQWQQTVEYVLEIEGVDRPALIAEWISQFFVQA